MERQVRGCGIDFALWIDLPPKGSIDRQLGRRWKDSSVVHINDDVEPFGLSEGEKAGGLVVRNNFKLKNREELKSWFSLFGTKAGEEHRLCWDEMKGDGTREEMTDAFKLKFKEILAFKEKEADWLKQKEQAAEAKKQQLEQEKKAEEELKEKCALSTAEAIQEKLGISLKSVALPAEFLEQVAGIWNSAEAPTVTSLKRAFK